MASTESESEKSVPGNALVKSISENGLDKEASKSAKKEVNDKKTSNKERRESDKKTIDSKDSKSSKKKHRSRSRSRKRSRSKGRRSRSRHKSPKRKRSPTRKRRSRSRERRSRSRDKRSKSRDKRRKRSRSRDRRSRRSRSRNRKKKKSRSSSSSSSSSSSDDEKSKTEAKTSNDTHAVKEKSKATEEKSNRKEATKSKDADAKSSKQDKKTDSRSRKRSRSTERKRKSRSRSPQKKRRRRSRSRERRRSRDRSRRSRSRGRRSRSRKRSRSRDRDKSKSTAEKDSKKPPKFTDVNPLSKDFEQAKLEDEMNKRRERVEKWRLEQKKKKLTAIKSAASDDEEDKPRKVWSLEDDDDDEEVEKSEDKENEDESKNKEVNMEDDEVDPLDAFMKDLNQDKKTENKAVSNDAKEKPVDSTNGPKVSRISAVAKKNRDVNTKGELMEGNADAMEYSSEEEEESLDKAFSKFQNKQQPKKLGAEIDHSKINYESFRKNFYVEVPELAALTTEEVEGIRMNMENIKIRGKNCPKPIQSWVQAGVSYKVLSALKKANYEKPTIIQAQAIPAIMAGNDLIGIAKTGSGKTVAFLLPMFRHIMDQRPLDNGEGPISVIMTPTRELALQITKECKKFTKSLKLRVCCVYGGTGISEQIADLKRGAEIIVCTPGRMIDMLGVNGGRVTNLRRCTYLVLDEADRMFDMGFEPQVMHVIKSCRPDRQTVLFSATFPRQMEALARRILNKPIEVQVGGRSIVCSDVAQEVLILAEEHKYLKLLELLGQYQENGAVLVFVDKQERADSLLKDLMGSSYSCMALHGGIDQYDRDSIINDFKSGVNRLLIATSVAARGLDVKNLVLVLNYSCPNHYEDYVHRCGRTGRAGRKGTAITFITEDQAKYAGEIIKALELSAAKVPPDLEKLWTRYKEELKAQGKSVKSNSGFSGRGFKFDETEEAMAKERKQIQKAALGLQDSDEDEPAQNIDEKIESMFNSKRTVKDISAPLGNTSGGAGAGGSAAANKAKLDVAKKLASRINMQKNLGAGGQDVMQQAATALMKGGGFAPKVSAKTIAEQLAEKINQKLNYVPQEKPEPEEEEEATLKRYEEELEINDFPQTCRWKVTSKDTLIQICDYSEAGITIRGQYYPPGKQPGEDDRKLYLAIEAVSEIAVQKAKNEITRLIKEELIRLQNSYQPINKNRYKVM